MKIQCNVFFSPGKKDFFKKYSLGSEDLINRRLTSPKPLLVLNLKPRYAKNSDFQDISKGRKLQCIVFFSLDERVLWKNIHFC